ncbi:Ran-binding protein M homolog [Linum perenne]
MNTAIVLCLYLMSMTAATTLSFEIPTKLKLASKFAVISPDKLSVKGNTTLPITVGSVQSNKPVSVHIGSEYYFEMWVKNAGSKTEAAIGFTVEGYRLSKHIGFDADSVGYYGHPGKLYGEGSSEIGSKFTTNDIVGAGINYTSNEFFFTKNGELVGTLSKKIDDPLFPTILVYGLDEELEVNFGHKPFVYDIETRYRCLYWDYPVNDDSLLSLTKDGSLKKLMKISESMFRKSIEEKEKEVASLKIVMKALNDNLEKYL